MKSVRLTSFEKERADVTSEISSQLESQFYTIGSFNPSRRPFAGGWKPIIDGKVQFSIEPGALSATFVKGGEATMQAAAASPLTPTPMHQPLDNPSSSGATATSEVKKLDEEDSDYEPIRVSDFPCKNGASSGGGVVASQSGRLPSSRKRGGVSADKEHKRLKRLLRNRVSAQQARERKKAYLSDLEVRSKELEQNNASLEEKVSTLIKENIMLRQIIKNTAIKNIGGGADTMDN
ncbi:hypothetical protein O6H91_04G118200 [Diphasiastrum complanatum]|uniref:Uncharacterized protein n=1 Tax=Diphasiastrum complanatum TaxID=34168 RepID=A0ACC2E1D0_DIPCM|nr:hypothetical protein O6H91_04G118200 [Diphasiastrum complanatum]